jgi:hypothetical protein
MNWGATKQSLTGLTLGALAFGLVMLGTRPPGPGLYGDSAGYMGAAESLVQHGTLRVPFAPYTSADSTSPLAQWPPGFPVAIAAPMMLGANAVTGARLVVAASAAVTVWLAVLLVGSTFGFAWGLVVALVLVLTASVVAVHLDALSEPPFISAVVATLFLMANRPDRPLQYGLTGALALMLRYVGLGVVAACGVWAAMQPAPSRGVRLRRGIVAVLPGVIAYVAWAVVVSAHGGTVRRLHLDHYPLQTLRQFLGATLSWLGPDPIGVTVGAARFARAAMKVVLIVGVVCVIAREWQQSRIVRSGVLLGVACAGLLLVAQLLQGNVELSDRMFSPVHAVLDIAIVAALAAWWPWSRRHAIALAALGVWGIVSVRAVGTLVYVARTEGFYHAKLEVVRSGLWTWVRDSAQANSAGAPGNTAALYSNDVADVYFATHRPSRAMPWIVDPDTARALATALARQPSLVIWASGYTESVIFPELRPIAATPERLEALLHLKRRAVFPEGIVWEYVR